MKIESVRMQNFRSFDDETISLNDYSCLVGPNGSGKSTVLCALNVFFRETADAATDLTLLSEEDFHHKNKKQPIVITVTFVDLDEKAQSDFSDYYRQGKLIVSAVAEFDTASGKAEVKQYGQRLGMDEFKPFFEAYGDGEKVAILKEKYATIRKDFPELPVPGTKDAMFEALRTYESERPEKLKSIKSEDQFYGISKGANRLAKYIQWVHVPAVKDASAEQVEGKDTALGKLLIRTVRTKINFEEGVEKLRKEAQQKYQALLDSSQAVLDEISKALGKRVAEWAHPDAKVRLEWKQDPDRSVRVDQPWAHIVAGEGDFEGELARFGHGLQRSYLLALLQELASNNDSGEPTLILACEEPELYQHPPQARHLADVLRKLSKANSQIIVSTHSPLFVSGESIEDLRMVRRHRVQKKSVVSRVFLTEIAEAIAKVAGEPPTRKEGVLAKVHQALQPELNEMFFTKRLVLVEGLEDVAYITTYLNLLGLWEEFRRAGGHIVPANAKSEMTRPLVVAKRLNIPTFIVFDSDADKPDKNGSRARNEKDNKSLLALSEVGNIDPMPKDTVWHKQCVMWHSDIGSVIRDDIGATEWATNQTKADLLYGNAGNLRKNILHIGAALSFAWHDKKVSKHLERLCKLIVEFCKAAE